MGLCLLKICVHYQCISPATQLYKLRHRRGCLFWVLYIDTHIKNWTRIKVAILKLMKKTFETTVSSVHSFPCCKFLCVAVSAMTSWLLVTHTQIVSLCMPLALIPESQDRTLLCKPSCPPSCLLVGLVQGPPFPLWAHGKWGSSSASTHQGGQKQAELNRLIS